MSFAWDDLAAAAALFLVIEGVIPFLSPARFKAAMARVVAISDVQLRIAGFGSMAVGLLLLIFIRS